MWMRSRSDNGGVESIRQLLVHGVCNCRDEGDELGQLI